MHAQVNGNYLNVVQVLLADWRVDPNVPNPKGRSALHLAVQNQRPEIAAELLRHHAVDVNLLDCNGDSALHIAARWNSAAMVSLLLPHPSIDLALLNGSKKTALECTSSQAVRELLRAGPTAVHASSGSSLSPTSTPPAGPVDGPQKASSWPHESKSASADPSSGKSVCGPCTTLWLIVDAVAEGTAFRLPTAATTTLC